MRLLVSGALKTVEQLAQTEDAQFLGHLLVPGQWNNYERIFSTGLPVACDNGCFTKLDRERYLRMLRLLRGRSVLWVTVPDVVGDSVATRLRFRLWLPALRYYNHPAAFVAQDGQGVEDVPWGSIVCLFIGGTTAWKEGPEALKLVVAAKQRGKWVHIGRVNSARRERLFAPFGADSLDGSQYSMFPGTYIPSALSRLRRYQEEFTSEPFCSAVPSGDRRG